jgi:hypothetical protein
MIDIPCGKALRDGCGTVRGGCLYVFDFILRDGCGTVRVDNPHTPYTLRGRFRAPRGRMERG